MGIAERLRELRENKNFNKKQLSDDIGIAYTTYNNWETGAREPNSEYLQFFAKYYNVTVDYILGLSEDYNKVSGFEVSSHETMLLIKYRAINDENKKRVDNVLDYEYSLLINDKINNL